MKTAGILTVGGDTPALNALIKFIRDILVNLGFSVIIGFEGGFWGLITNTHKGNIIRQAINEKEGGTFLNSLRETPLPPPNEEERIKNLPEKEKKREILFWKAKLKGAINTIKELKLDLLIIIGGDGTAQVAKRFARELKKNDISCKVIFIPRTIDNDLDTFTRLSYKGTSLEIPLCPGYPTAALNIAREAKTLRTTAESTHRIFTMQVMGRDAGWLALAGSAGWAEVVLIPEVNIVNDPQLNQENKEKLKRNFSYEVSIEEFFEIVVEKTKQNKPFHSIVVVSEGIFIDAQQIYATQYGKRKLGGAGDRIARMIMDYLKNGALDIEAYPNIKRRGNKIPPLKRRIEVRHHDTGYGPRKGPPCQYDLFLAQIIGYFGIEKILKEEAFGHMPTIKEVVSLKELKEIVNNPKEAREMIQLIDIENVKQKFVPVRALYDCSQFTTSPLGDIFLYKLLAQEGVSYP